MDDNSNEWYGKELQPGAYIRHGYSIKYQCQCPAKFHPNCSFIQPILTQCVDGHWTNGGPHCREGENALFCLCSTSLDCLLSIEEIFDKCPLPSDIPYLLLNNSGQANAVLNEGESLDYECIDGYARMSNVTCIQGYLTAQPLCEPSNVRWSLSILLEHDFFPSENCTTHPYWIKNGYVKYQNRRHGGHAEYSVMETKID
jgi:hypothetical protein